VQDLSIALAQARRYEDALIDDDASMTPAPQLGTLCSARKSVSQQDEKPLRASPWGLPFF